MCDSFGQKATAAGQSHPPRFYNFVTTWSTRNQGQAPAACTSTEDGKVHMANGVHISGEAYTTLMVTQKSSMFCKK
ncbi:uncharacterized protein LOC144115279 isoform X2 [Amblyomma americanum]